MLFLVQTKYEKKIILQFHFYIKLFLHKRDQSKIQLKLKNYKKKKHTIYNFFNYSDLVFLCFG